MPDWGPIPPIGALRNGTPQQPHPGFAYCPTSTLSSSRATSGVAVQRRRRGPRAHPAGQAGNYPVLLVDGVVGEVWHQRCSGRKLAITVEPLRKLTATQRRQLDDEVGLVGAVMEARPMLTIGVVTVGRTPGPFCP
jgi:hypothetical protein